MNHYKEYKPNTHLSRYIECIWTLTGKNDKTNSIVETLVPGGRAEFIFTQSDFLWHGSKIENEGRRAFSSFLLGQRNCAKYITCLNTYSCIGVRLRCGCLPVFSVFPANSYSNNIVLLKKIYGNEIDELTKRLFEQNLGDGVRILESWLEKYVTVLNSDWENLQGCLEKIAKNRNLGPLSLKTLLDDHGWSDKKTERMFLKYVGFTPTQFIKTLRFRKSLEKLFGSTKNLTVHAIDSGFYDQSHFIREFHRYAGNSPSDFLKETNTIVRFLYKN